MKFINNAGIGWGVARTDIESVKAITESTVIAANAEALALGMANRRTQLEPPWAKPSLSCKPAWCAATA